MSRKYEKYGSLQRKLLGVLAPVAAWYFGTMSTMVHIHLYIPVLPFPTMTLFYLALTFFGANFLVISAKIMPKVIKEMKARDEDDTVVNFIRGFTVVMFLLGVAFLLFPFWDWGLAVSNWFISKVRGQITQADMDLSEHCGVIAWTAVICLMNIIWHHPLPIARLFNRKSRESSNGAHSREYSTGPTR